MYEILFVSFFIKSFIFSDILVVEIGEKYDTFSQKIFFIFLRSLVRIGISKKNGSESLNGNGSYRLGNITPREFL